MISFTHSSGTKRSLTTDGIQTTTFIRTTPPPSNHDKYPPPPKSHDILKLSTPLTVFKSSTEQSTKLQSSDQKQDFQIKFEV